MSRRRWIDRWLHWTTLVALVAATLAPGMAHALRHVRGETVPWTQICSASGGIRRVQLPGEPTPGQAQHAFEHCSACALHFSIPAPPPPLGLNALRTDLAQAAPVPLLRAPRPLYAWRSAPARAPPTPV